LEIFFFFDSNFYFLLFYFSSCLRSFSPYRCFFSSFFYSFKAFYLSFSCLLYIFNFLTRLSTSFFFFYKFNFSYSSRFDSKFKRFFSVSISFRASNFSFWMSSRVSIWFWPDSMVLSSATRRFLSFSSILITTFLWSEISFVISASNIFCWAANPSNYFLSTAVPG
jgi:hypothetical protein